MKSIFRHIHNKVFINCVSLFLEMYLPNEEEYSRRVNKMLFYCIIGLSCVAVVMVCLHVVLYFVIKLYPYKATTKMSI